MINFVRIVLLIAVMIPAAGSAEDDPATILERVDRYRLPLLNVEAGVVLDQLNLREGVKGKSSAYRVFLNEYGDSVVIMLNTSERGRRVLMTDDAVWLKIPTANRPIRITPLQRLLGQANYGDVGRISWHQSYALAGTERETGMAVPFLEDVGRILGTRFPRLEGRPLRKLELRAIKATATYPKILVWVNEDDLAPVRADYFLTSGKRLKTGWFSIPEDSEQGKIVRSVLFLDDKSEGAGTVMTTTSAKARTFARKAFTVRGFTKISD